MTSTELKDKIVSLLEDKKGLEIETIEISAKSSIADYFVIASGNTKIQVRALTDYVEEILEKEDDLRPLHADGREGGAWLVLDYGIVIVHVFDKETREQYQLEKLWNEER